MACQPGVQRDVQNPDPVEDHEHEERRLPIELEWKSVGGYQISDRFSFSVELPKHEQRQSPIDEEDGNIQPEQRLRQVNTLRISTTLIRDYKHRAK